MADNKRDLLLKIKALAERGAPHERESAQQYLTRLMKKYGYTESDLSEDEKACEWFRYKNEIQRRLLMQIMYMVVGTKDFYSWKHSRRKQTGVYCTASQRIEIQMNFDFFVEALEKELDLFMTAFSNKNHLFPANVPAKKREMSKTEMIKLGFMMDGMDEHTLVKRFGGSEHENH